LNGTYQLLIHFYDFDLLDEYRYNTNKTTEALSDNSKKVGLELKSEKPECIFKFRHGHGAWTLQ
jgi:hypothetical protein